MRLIRHREETPLIFTVPFEDLEKKCACTSENVITGQNGRLGVSQDGDSF